MKDPGAHPLDAVVGAKFFPEAEEGVLDEIFSELGVTDKTGEVAAEAGALFVVLELNPVFEGLGTQGAQEAGIPLCPGIIHKVARRFATRTEPVRFLLHNFRRRGEFTGGDGTNGDGEPYKRFREGEFAPCCTIRFATCDTHCGG